MNADLVVPRGKTSRKIWWVFYGNTKIQEGSKDSRKVARFTGMGKIGKISVLTKRGYVSVSLAEIPSPAVTRGRRPAHEKEIP